LLSKYFQGYYAKPEEVEEEEEVGDDQEESKEVKPKKEKGGKNEPKKPEFRVIRDVIETRCLEEPSGKPVTISDIICNLLVSLTEESEDVLNTYLPEFMNDVLDKKNSKNAQVAELTKGVDKFMIMISDVMSDAPHMPSTFFTRIMTPLLEKKMLTTKDMEWCEKDPEEIFATEGHFKVFLYLLKWQEV